MKQWYVIQVQVGGEGVVKTDLQKRIEETGLADKFGEIMVPSAKVREFFGEDAEGEKDQQLFPGYVLVEMDAAPEAVRLVLQMPRVVRFLGGTNPVPLSKREIEQVLAQMRGEVAVSVEKNQFEVGKEIEIKSGAFAGFVGIVDAVDEENEKLTVMVSIFGRMTPVELGFDQVKR